MEGRTRNAIRKAKNDIKINFDEPDRLIYILYYVKKHI